MLSRSYCTLALRDASPFSVNLHVFVFCPPLEQAPDQMASRPSETLSVITVPGANDPEPEVPVATLIPAGLEVTRSPPLPLAVTLRVAVPLGAGAGAETGFSVRLAERVTPPPETEIVTTVCVVTSVVEMLKPPAVLPAGIRTELDGLTAGLLLVTWKIWSVVEGEAIFTVPKEPADPVTDDGLRVSEAGCPCGVRVTCDCTLWPFHVAVMVATVFAATIFVGMGKDTVGSPAATVAIAGGRAACESLLKSTVAPPAGARPLRVAMT